MICPNCSGRTEVTHTRSFQKYTRRHRVCPNCGEKITTYETLKPPEQRYPMGRGKVNRRTTPKAVCRYNSGIGCDAPSCDGCGWNPNTRRG